MLPNTRHAAISDTLPCSGSHTGCTHLEMPCIECRARTGHGAEITGNINDAPSLCSPDRASAYAPNVWTNVGTNFSRISGQVTASFRYFQLVLFTDQCCHYRADNHPCAQLFPLHFQRDAITLAVPICRHIIDTGCGRLMA